MKQQHDGMRDDIVESEYITVSAPRELWWRVKYEARRRRRTTRYMLATALFEALLRWEAETDDEIRRREEERLRSLNALMDTEYED